jgi:hypothetical protein
MSQLTKSSWSGHSFVTLLAALVALCLSTPLHSTSAAAADPTGDNTYLGSADDPLNPVQIGPREQVGKRSIGEKAAASAIGGVMSGLLGGSSRKSSKPKTRRDPTRKLDYNHSASESFDTETQARAQWTKEGLLISSRLEESPGKGTFQSLFLESCDGRRLYPQRYDIYDLWNDSSLSVSWSSSSASNGDVVSQQSGGWSNTWSDDVSGMDGSLAGEAAGPPGTWQQLGFDRAQGGVRQIGAYFNLTAQSLSSMGELGLFIHSSRPLLDPVTTAPVHWMVGPGTDKQPQLTTTVSSEPATSNQRQWQNASAVCQQQNALLLASAAAIPMAVIAGIPGSAAIAVKGYPVPDGLTIKAKGTGQTTGHIADLTISPSEGEEWPSELPMFSFYIPSNGRHQSYVAKPIQIGSLAGAGPQTIPVYGYCGNVHLPPVPAGVDLPPPSEWVVLTGPIENINIPSRPGSLTTGRALIPGTDITVPRAIDSSQEPLLTAPLLLAAMEEIERKTIDLQASGDLRTPFTGNEQREREAVVQQTLWIYAAELEGEPYTEEDFTGRMEQQYEDRNGIPITAAKPEDQERLEQGADDFWGAFELVGVEAKVISDSEEVTPVSENTTETEAIPEPIPEGDPPPEEVAEDGCVGNEHIHHSPRQVNVVISDSYGDDESRKKISDGIKEAVESEEEAYVTGTPPATAYSIWRDDSIGGISTAYAKTVFLEKNSQDWVWSTDPMKTSAKGTGTHTLSFEPGPGCTATVAGAALMWMKSSSSALDPLENSIEAFRALTAVKDLSVDYVAGKLPPGIGDAVEAGVDAITDPASDTYAAARGTATLVVGGQTDGGTSANRVDYKRKDKEDEAITGGGASFTKLFASDVKPNALTSKINASVEMEAGASGNGLAKAYLESFYGTLLVGVCECPTFTSYEILTDTNQFIRSDAVKGAVSVAKDHMQEVAERIGKGIESGEQDIDGESLKKRVERELKDWGEDTTGHRFKPAEASSD